MYIVDFRNLIYDTDNVTTVLHISHILLIELVIKLNHSIYSV